MALKPDPVQPDIAPAPPAGAKTSALAIDPTEFKLGWRILVIAMLGLGIAANASFLYVFGTLVIPLEEAFGWERADMQLGISFLFGSTVVAVQLVGWLNLRYGMKQVTCVSLVALAVVFAAMTQMGQSIGWFYLFCALLPFASLGTIAVTWTHLVNLWFARNRGLALALALSGTGLTAILLPSAVIWVIGQWGWQAAFLLLAALPLVLLPLVLGWMRLPQGAMSMPDGKRNAPTAARPALSGMTYAASLRSLRFWWLNIALALVVAAIVTMVANTVPLLRDMGLTAATASAVFGSFGVSLIGGRLLVGYLLDRVWAPAISAVALALPALGCLLLGITGPTEIAILVLAVMLLGVGAGAEMDIAAYLVSRYFGLRDYGRVFGMHLSTITLFAALAPFVMGPLYEATGSYNAMLAICGAAFLTGALMLLPLGRYPEKWD